jgi:hypothetical protein
VRERIGMTADVLILGSGPAGHTAAIYAARAGRKTQLIAGYQPGGQLMITSLIENYPGFAKPIAGPLLMDQMRQQVVSVGVDVIGDTITAVDFSSNPLKCIGESGVEYVRQLANKEGWGFFPPERIADIVEAFKRLTDDELAVVAGAMRGAIQGLAEAKGRKATGMDGLPG